MPPLNWTDITANAQVFSQKWEQADGREEAESQSFLHELLAVFGAPNAHEIGTFEYRVSMDDGQNGYIDYLWPKTIAIEMKSKGKDLKKAYAQLKEYIVHLKAEDMPDLLMVCDFQNIWLYSRTTKKQTKFKTRDLAKKVRLFASLAGYEASRTYDEQTEVNVQASEKMARLHNAMEASGYEGHDLQVYLVRLLFCLFADDTLIFPKDAFLNYVENSREDGSDLAQRLGSLFEVLDMPPEERKKKKFLPPELLQFAYINGGLFAGPLPQAGFDAKMRQTLIDAGLFDWRHISPAIFGSMFQGVMDKKLRHDMGAHYTSEENILKVINPLFMDELWAEFDRVKSSPAQLDALHTKIASLKFLDPACGCGNFLIIAYRELRRLEYSILQMKKDSNALALDPALLVKVSVDQFYGIELEDFPCQIAKVGMWLMDHLMNHQLTELFGKPYLRIPLKKSAHIHQGNALAMDWNDVVPASELSYILGNPPFLGARVMDKKQKEELVALFPGEKNTGNLDYVSGWYKKACNMMQENQGIRAALVSTNSISQGEQVSILWKNLFDAGIHINFAYRTFKWSNEAKGNAHVHCVIIGFSFIKQETGTIYDGETEITAVNINGYLLDGPNIYVASHNKPLCNIPAIGMGNQPIDNGEYLFLEDEKKVFLQKEPKAKKYFYSWMGAEEFLNGKKRFCLYLGKCSPAELNSMPECLKRVAAVKEYRAASKRLSTQKMAERAKNFQTENIPDSSYIIVPKVSSERRQYIPIGFLDKTVLTSDAAFIIPKATMFHFGILTSIVHNAWMRAVAGRLKSDYRYSKDVVYNNFPWPEKVTAAQRSKIEKLTRAVLDARAAHSDSTLADLYNPLTMPDDLRKAHKALDKAVLSLYGYKTGISEAEIVADLLTRYAELAKEEPKEAAQKTAQKGTQEEIPSK